MKNFVRNIEELSAVFESGEIPDFRDAEIESILLSRENGVFIEVVVLIYRIVEEYKIGARHIRRRKNAYCTFRFTGAETDSLQNFDHQNVICDVDIVRAENAEMLAVHFRPVSGCDLRFRCREIELTRVRLSESVKESRETT